jgi:enoyl-CoA hydratase
MTEPVFLTQELGPILEFTLNRPEKLNAINEEILYGLRAAVETLQDREDLRVMLIRSTGRYFCAGADLTNTPMPDLKNSSSNVRSWYRRGLAGMLALYQEIEACEKPLVVAHHATCMGGGLELSLSCDFRLAATSAAYAFPEAKFGSIPATGGVSRLTRYVGPHWARWLIMANKQIDAAQALNIGLVHAVYPDDAFEAEVLAFCQHLAKQPPEVTAMAKIAIELATDLESAQARNMERMANSVLSLGDEHIGLLAALKAKLAGGKKGG